MDFFEHIEAIFFYPVNLFIFKSALWVCGLMVVVFIVNLKLKRFRNKYIIRTIIISIILYFISFYASGDLLNPWSLRYSHYVDAVEQILLNNMNNAYSGFELAQYYDEFGHRMHLFDRYEAYSDYSTIPQYTGEIEDNLKALEHSLDSMTLKEIAGSSDNVTSVSYLYKSADFDTILIDTFSDGSVFIAFGGKFDELFDDSNLLIGNETFYLEYHSLGLCKDILDALINTDSAFSRDALAIDGEGSLEYINVTIGGNSYNTYGFKRLDEDSIFGSAMQDIIAHILNKAYEEDNRISRSEILSITRQKDEEVGNTSLTNYRWAAFYYEYVERIGPAGFSVGGNGSE